MLKYNRLNKINCCFNHSLRLMCTPCLSAHCRREIFENNILCNLNVLIVLILLSISCHILPYLLQFLSTAQLWLDIFHRVCFLTGTAHLWLGRLHWVYFLISTAQL